MKRILALTLLFAAVAAHAGPTASVPPPPTVPTLVMSLESGYPRVKYPDGLTSLNNKCIVKTNRLSTAIRPVYVNGMPIAFCCTGCPGVFSVDPDPYLTKQKIRVQCAVDPSKPAKFSPTTRCLVGHDLFYFSSPAALEKFRQSPLTYAGELTDPVLRERFKTSATSPHISRDGRDYYFKSPAARARFEAHPDSFAVRQGA